MKVELLNYTPLQICSNAIRTCWQSFDKSDTIDGVCGKADKALIDRVGNQFKHGSTLEHLRLCFNTDNNNIAQVFKENDYSVVTGISGNWTISTNVRALQDIEISLETKHLLIPKEYVYLFK